MDSVRDLYLVGLSHRTAPAGVREQYSVKPEDLVQCLNGLVPGAGVHEAAVISTCNRTEVLVRAEEGQDPIAQVQRALFRNLDSNQVYSFSGLHAIIHLFRVAAGLDSLVLGESEILGQVRRAQDTAREAGTLGALLKPLMSQALAVGKRVRSDTDIGQGSLSVARIAVDVAQRAFGDLGDERALVIGTGETGLLVAKHLAASGMREIDFANRTRQRAEVAASEYHGKAYGLDQLADGIAGVDIVAVAVDGAPDLIHRSMLNLKALRRRDMPLFLLDLCIPRAVAQDVVKMDEVITYGLDDLTTVVEKNRAERATAVAEADEMIVGEVHEFLSRRAYALFSPTLAELPPRFQELREQTLDQITGGQATPREIELAHELTKRLLHMAQSQMKEGVRRVRSEAALDAEYQRFLENL